MPHEYFACVSACQSFVSQTYDGTVVSTGSAGGAREGQNMAHLGHINGPFMYFDLP